MWVAEFQGQFFFLSGQSSIHKFTFNLSLCYFWPHVSQRETNKKNVYWHLVFPHFDSRLLNGSSQSYIIGRKKMVSDSKSLRFYLSSAHWLLCNLEQLI